MVFCAFGVDIVGGRGAAGEGGGGGGGGKGLAGGEAESGVGLFAAAGGLVEDGAVDLGDDEVVGAAGVEGGGGGGGAVGEGVEVGLGEEAEVHDGD